MAKQVDTGKALEYSFATSYFEYLKRLGLYVDLVRDKCYDNTQNSFNTFSPVEQRAFINAATASINTMVKIEPSLVHQKNQSDLLTIRISPDSAGKMGDVRDIVFSRTGWEIGFSVKNNHDAAKHSRLSPSIDFGKLWLDYPCSQAYFDEINIVFGKIDTLLKINRKTPWESAFTSKFNDVYIPLLEAFKREMGRLYTLHPDIPSRLLKYLIGNNSFYKMIKMDRYNLIVVKGFNMNKDLGKSYNKVKAVCGIPSLGYPTRIIEFIRLPLDNTSLFMTLDNGWQIKFRIHSASSTLERSLKFDITLIGNPPILFTHHIF